MYYDLGLMISVASQRGITLGQPCDFEQIVDQKELDHFIQISYKCKETNHNSLHLLTKKTKNSCKP
jgi:hypothetical protein